MIKFTMSSSGAGLGVQVDANVLSFQQLMEKKLFIPEYQRPYTWGPKHLHTMLDDFDEHYQTHKQFPYYMGSLIMHKDKDKYYIVDGQQRLTTLLILKFLLNDQDDDCRKIMYSNPASTEQIKNNYTEIKNDERIQAEVLPHIFELLRFTVITTTHQDNAFIFFDTQNNRGVKPSVTVLHKAYNLRCIDGQAEETQKICAQWWEGIDSKQAGTLGLAEEPRQLEWILQLFLWRTRYWRGDNRQSFGSYEEWRDAFTKQLRDKDKAGYGEYFDNYSVRHTVRQPIYQGVRFFRFVRHYSQLLEEVMMTEVAPKTTFRRLSDIHGMGSKYMSSFFTMVGLVYYDKFGLYKLPEFVKALSDSMAHIRMQQSRICKVTMEKNFIRVDDRRYAWQNILDFISSAFDAQEILDWWKKGEMNCNDDNNESYGGTRGRFWDAYKNIYRRSEDNRQ